MPENTDTVAAALIGKWTLISCEGKTTSGKTFYPYGENPQGSIIYNEQGHMSAHLMRGDRPSLNAETFRDITADELAEAFKGYFAYYGTYTLQENEGTVTHDVEGALHPNWVGSTQVRSFKFEGDHLVLQAVLPGSIQTLVWKKEH